MTINFKLNGMPFNNPDSEDHKRIQSDIRDKIELAIKQNSDSLKIESTANLEIDYNEATIDKPNISLNGFGPDSNAKMLEILKGLFTTA
jgi:hypothetical protein